MKTITPETAQWILKTMENIRNFENKVDEIFLTGQIPGFAHLYAGEEAIATGVCAHLTDSDYITSTHRGHGHCIAKGCDMNKMMAEIFGKKTGLCHGKGGSMHIADIDRGVLGANGIVGGGFSLAVGAAATGLRPVPELMFNDFLGFCLDTLLNQGSKMRYIFGGKAQIPLTVRTCHGAGASAAEQHSGSYYGMLGALPGIKVVVPSTPYDAKGLLLSAIEDNNIVIFFEDKKLYSVKGEVPEEYYTIDIGKANILRDGEDLTIVTIGKMAQVGLEVAQKLADKQISTEVIDLRTVAPWDQETVLKSVKKNGSLDCD